MSPSTATSHDTIGRLFSRSAERVLAVTLGATGIALLDMELRKDPRVGCFEPLPMGPGAKNEAIQAAIAAFIKKNNLSHRNAVLVPSLSSLFVRRAQLPLVPDKELPDAIAWHFKDEVPLEASDLVLDFSVIKKTSAGDGSQLLDVICALAQEREVRAGVEVLAGAGLTCLAVIPVPFAYPRFIERFLSHAQEKNKVSAVLHIEETSSFIGIYKAHQLEFYRELPFSVERMRQALKNVLVSEGGRVEFTPQEIEEILTTIGVAQDSSLYKKKISLNQIFSMLRPDLERLLEELGRSMHYHETSCRGERPAHLFIAASGSAIPKLDGFLSAGLSLPVSPLPVPAELGVTAGIDTGALQRHLALAGAALGYKESINLLPREFRAQKIEKVQRVSLRWLVLFALLFLGLSYVFAKAGVSGYQRRLDNSLLHLSVLSEVRHLKDKVDGFNAFVSSVRKNEPAAADILKNISATAGPELFITELSLNAESKSGAMRGFVKSANRNPDVILAEFIGALQASGHCKDVTIGSVEKSAEADAQKTVFQISFKLS